MTGVASQGLAARGMPRLPGQGAGQRAGTENRPAGRPAVDTSRERSGITTLTWAFILLTIAAIVLGIIVVRQALLVTQPGVGQQPPAEGQQRPGEVPPSSEPAALSKPTSPRTGTESHTRARLVRWFVPGKPGADPGDPAACSVTDLTSSGKSPGASEGSTACPLR
jgi:hypothetical protein